MGVSTLGGGVTASRRAGGRGSVTENQLFEALCQNFGVLACAAIHLGLTLASLVQRVARSKRLRAGRDGARSVMIGYANERLQGAVSAGEAWALQFQARAGVSADAGKPLESPPLPSHRVAQPVAQSEPRPDLAEALSRRLVVALDRGEPWAVMYCLSHLNPDGPFFARCRRGWQHDLWAEQLAAAPMVTMSAAKPGDREVVDAKKVLEGRGDAEPRLTVDADEGVDGVMSAPPVRARSVAFSPQPSCRLVMAVSAQADATEAACLAPPISGGWFERWLRLPAGGSGVGSGGAPPVRARSVDFSPQPSCRQLAVSAQADATKTACLAPPVCGGWFQRRQRLPAGGSGVGSGEAPPVRPRGLDLRPQPDFRQLMAASAQVGSNRCHESSLSSESSSHEKSNHESHAPRRSLMAPKLIQSCVSFVPG